jgi:outer membrane protein assembly factor BamB
MAEPFVSPPPTTPRRIKLKWLFLWVGIVLAAVAFIAISRYQAVDSDHASANVNSVIGSLVIWLATVSLLLISRLWSYVFAFGLVPVLAAISFLSIFRLERVDGELRPHFTRRWSSGPELPAVSIDSEQVSLSDTLFQPQSTDWNQFLGPNRNTSLSSCSIDTDWSSSQGDEPQVVWRQPIGEGWSGFAVRGSAAITMEQRGEEEWVSAYNLETGAVIWKYAMDSRHSDPLGGTGPRSTPTIHDDKVFACSAVSKFVCLQLTTGKELWSHELNQLAGVEAAELDKDVEWGRSGSPLVVGTNVIVPLGGKAKKATSLIAFDIQTGKEAWRSGEEQISYSSPMLVRLDDIEQIVYPTQNDLTAFDLVTGKKLWSFRYEGSGGAPNVAQPVPLDGVTLFISKGYGVGARTIEVRRAAEAAKDDQAWKVSQVNENRTVMRTKFTNAVLWKDHILGLSDGILECIDARTLKRKWKSGRYRQGQVLLLANCLLVTAEDGRVVLVGLDEQKHVELAEKAVIGDVTWNPPTLAGNRLLVRNSNEVACLRLKLKDVQQ